MKELHKREDGAGRSNEHSTKSRVWKFQDALWNLVLSATMRPAPGAPADHFLLTLALENTTTQGKQDIKLVDEQEMIVGQPQYYYATIDAPVDNSNSYILNVTVDFTVVIVDKGDGTYNLQFGGATINPSWTVGELDIEQIIYP